MQKWVVVFFVILCGFSFRANAAIDTDTPYSHVYYLFLDRGDSCKACYVPMLITRLSIDKDNLATGGIDNVVVVTYERDSIWRIEPKPAALDKSTVLLHERKLKWKDDDYRYQEVDRSEALRILNNPMGTIPISRPAFLDHQTDPKEALRRIQAPDAMPESSQPISREIIPVLIRDLSLASDKIG